jgi:hypothetical protein
MKKLIFGLFATTSIIFSACEKETSSNSTGCTPTATSRSVSDLPADTIIGVNNTSQGPQPYGANIKTYYSLVNDSIVPASDSSTLKWDISLMNSEIRLNENSGSQAGAFIFNGVYNDLCSVPDSIFLTGGNAFTALKSWYNYDETNYILSPKPGKVLIFKTANGKYVKMEILNYYKGGITPTPAGDPSYSIRLYNTRYYTFRYTYQPDGTTNF